MPSGTTKALADPAAASSLQLPKPPRRIPAEKAKDLPKSHRALRGQASSSLYDLEHPLHHEAPATDSDSSSLTFPPSGDEFDDAEVDLDLESSTPNTPDPSSPSLPQRDLPLHASRRSRSPSPLRSRPFSPTQYSWSQSRSWSHSHSHSCIPTVTPTTMSGNIMMTKDMLTHLLDRLAAAHTPAAPTPTLAPAAPPLHSKIHLGNSAAFNSKGFWDSADHKLSLLCANYDVWLQNVTLYLALAGLDSHIDAAGYMTYIPCPSVSNPAQGTEEIDKDNWDANNHSA
jgi:hypothetical protein